MPRLASSLARLALAAATLAACERAPGGEPAAAPLSADHAALLAQVPGGNHALFGGSYTKGFQKLFQDSPFAKFVAQGMAKAAPGTQAWMDCFLTFPDVAMLGGLRIAGTGLDLRFVMRGLGVKDIEACARKASFPVTVDADGGYVAIEMPNGFGGAPIKAGYLARPGGMLYFRQTVALGGAQTAVDRAGLEADVAALAQSSAANDTALLAEVARVDRRKAVWFAGSGAGTPLAAKLGAVRGWMDLEGGLALDVSLQLKDAAMADQLATGIGQAKQQTSALPPALATVVEKLTFERTGDRLRFAIAITNPELEALFAAIAPMMPTP